MRDFRDAKAMAQTVRAALAAKGLKITISESLELIATAFGVADWNTLSATIKGAREPELSQAPSSAPPADAPPTRAPPDAMPRAAGHLWFSATLEATLHRAVALAAARKHERTTVEHLLLALIEDADAAGVMRACKVDLGELEKTLTAFVDNELKSLAVGDGEEPAPTSGFQRVVQRARLSTSSHRAATRSPAPMCWWRCSPSAKATPPAFWWSGS